MAGGKARTRKTLADRLVENKRLRKEQYGLARQNFAGVGSMGIIGGTGRRGLDSNETSLYLRKTGDKMEGWFGIYPTTDTSIYPSGSNNNTLDITDANTSYWNWYAGGSNTLEKIVKNDSGTTTEPGSILVIESTETLTQTIVDESNASTSGANIKTLDGEDLELGTRKTLVVFMYGTADAYWHQISNPAGGSDLLSSTNTWTGGNTWTGSVGFAGASTSITSPNIYIGDATSDTVNILGNIASTGVNTWTGINTFSSGTSFSVTSPNIFIGDQSSDTINITGTASHQGDIDMNTWDIYAVDRVKFSQTEGSGDALASTDTGVEAIYTSGNPYGMKIQIPTANSAIFQIVRGGTEMLNISALGLLIGDDMSMSNNKITNLGDPSADSDAATKEYVDDNAGGSGANTSLSNLSSVSVNTSFDMNNNNITDCGQVDCTAITDTGTLMVDGSTYLNGAVNLGNSSGDDIDLEGKLDVRSNYTSSTVAFSGLYAVGYVTIKVGGSNKRLYYGAG